MQTPASTHNTGTNQRLERRCINSRERAITTPRTLRRCERIRVPRVRAKSRGARWAVETLCGDMGSYVHGYGTPEQERLVEQAEHWRHRLITDGTQLQPGTRPLEVDWGVGAVLAVLGQDRLFGVDIEPKQLDFAGEHLARAGVEATLREADA